MIFILVFTVSHLLYLFKSAVRICVTLIQYTKMNLHFVSERSKMNIALWRPYIIKISGVAMGRPLKIWFSIVDKLERIWTSAIVCCQLQISWSCCFLHSLEGIFFLFKAATVAHDRLLWRRAHTCEDCVVQCKTCNVLQCESKIDTLNSQSPLCFIWVFV
jgi:hypothetical protein